MKTDKSFVWFLIALAALLWCSIAVAVLRGQPPPAPGAGFTASGTIIVMVDGIPIASGGTINIRSGAGVIAHASPDPTLGGTDITFDADSAVMASKTYLQTAPLTVFASSANPSQSQGPDGLHYAADINPTITSYTPGATFVFVPDVPNMPGATLNLSAIGPVALNGTCPLACWAIYLPATSNPPPAPNTSAQFVLR